MTYRLGIDVGTTYTAAALVREGRVELFTLGDRATVMPSVAFLRSDGTVLVGEVANRRGVLEPERVAREFKRRIGDPTPMVVGGTPYAPDAFVAHILRVVLTEVTARQGGRPEAVALTHPANWGAYKLDFFRQAAGRAGLGGDGVPVTFLSEPEAAALHYAAGERVPAGGVVAVYDLGGGTFDAAVLGRQDDGRFQMLGRPNGLERMGGVDFDAAVLAHVDRVLDGAVSRLPEDEPSLLALARLRAECVTAKEALSRDTDVTIPVVLPGVDTTVRLTRHEFEVMISPALDETIAALRSTLQSAGVTPEDVHAVLLVGGSSRIPLVAALVSSELGRPTAVDAHPKHAVAQGAAVAAAGPDPLALIAVDQVPEVPGPPVAGEPAASVPAPMPQAPVPPPSGSWEPPLPTSGSPAPPSGLPASSSGHIEAPVPSPPAPSEPPGPPAMPTPARGRPPRRTVVIAAVVVLALGLAAALALRGDDGDGRDGREETASSPSEVPEPPEPEVPDARRADVPSPEPGEAPAAAGTPPTSADPEVQALIDGCAGDAADDCDRLHDIVGSTDDPVSAYVSRCGNRLETSDAAGACLLHFATVPRSSDPDTQALIDGCAGDAVDDCDRLYYEVSSGPINDYARACGHRPDPPDAGGTCALWWSAVPQSNDSDVQDLIDDCGEGRMDECDRLYGEVNTGPSSNYARTCGNRLETAEAQGNCTIYYFDVPSSADADIQALIEDCDEGAIDDCDRLYGDVTSGPIRDYARTCGFRLDAPDAQGDCILQWEFVPSHSDAEIQGLIDDCEASAAGCDELYDALNSGPVNLYARTCGYRISAPEAAGDCVGVTDGQS